MYTTIKRVLSALLCVVLLCGLIPSSAFAASETELKNLALGAAPSASDANDAQHIAQYAIDGNPDTYWCGNNAASHWLMVDLGKTAEIDHIRLLGWPGVEKGSFKFELSADGESWSTFAAVTAAAPVTSATVTNYPGLEGYFLTAWAVKGSGTGRYLRVTDFVFGDSQTQWPSVFELEVWGTEAKAEEPQLPDNIPVNPETPEVEIWDRTDIVLHSSTDYTEAGYNPYQDVTLDAVFTHEDGTEISIPGFWNGGNEYRVRFSPTKTGTWTYLITSNRRDDLGLFLKGSITAVANTSDTEIGTHGFIRLSDTGRYFTYDDGTPFYWLGDTHWQSMNFESITKCNYPGCTCGNQFLHELKNRKEKGFNVYQTYFSSEDDGKSQPYCTEPGFWLDGQLYSCVDPTTFSEKIDKMFDALAENDMVIALGYANQIPYQSMTPISQTQYKSTFSDIQNSFVRYWFAPIQKPPAKPQLTAEQQEQIRRVFHSAISAVAHFSKPSAPIASLVFDGLGIMTAGNLLDAAKTAASIADTIDQLTAADSKNNPDSETGEAPNPPVAP